MEIYKNYIYSGAFCKSVSIPFLISCEIRMWPFSKVQKFSVMSDRWKVSEKKDNILRKINRGE